MSEVRIERDSLGDVEVPAKARYGAQTQRALDNFTLGGGPLPASLIESLIQVKRAAAIANSQLRVVSDPIGRAIVQACDTLISEGPASHFPVDIFQTGSGTSSNMNANEVLARMAGELAGETVHPNDHVNASQSSNDVFPSAIRIACVSEIDRSLLPALAHLEDGLQRRTAELDSVVKTGRTHLMDAMPVTLGQTLSAWADQINANHRRLEQQLDDLLTLPQGGTAVGTGVNAHEAFAQHFVQALSAHTGLAFTRAPNPFIKMGAQDDLVALSGALKTLAVSLIKIANDLRWMNSGPLAGLGEIALPALQPGSSIMPGKVNPVIPEAVLMAATQVMGYDAAVGIAGQSSNFELNVMLPLLGHNLLSSIALLGASCHSLTDRAIAGFTVNEARIREPLARNPILVTALNSRIGYSRAADIAKRAYREGRSIVEVAAEETDIPREELEQLLDPRVLTGTGQPPG